VRIGAIPEGIFERLITLAGLAPTPVIDTFHAVVVARAVIVATKLGVFDFLARQPASAADAAAALLVDPVGLEKLLNLLVATKYLGFSGGRYSLKHVARKWLLRDAPASLHDNMMLRFLEWQAIEATEDFVRTGKALDVHDLIEGEQWNTYQRGMRSLARFSAGEVARRVPLARNPTAMLDIGGGHGTYSVAFCKRHASLKATILDLPEAVAIATPLLAEEKMGDRVVHRTGNALTEDLGRERYDVIFVAHLVHHFDRGQNENLVRRAAAALKPGGTLAILDVLRATAGAASQTGALLDLYFAVTSNSGTWSEAEIGGWFRAASLAGGKTLHLLTAPGISVMTAERRGE
jgi:2-polyprenyl-3-methyl-5-hydroxy-6-metoxy-1,4-benzoquinol methylase